MDVTYEIAQLLKRPVSLMSEEELEESFTKMVTIMEMYPQMKPSLKYVFASTLAAWGRHLERTGSYDKLFECYQKALCIFHDHEGILTNLGAHLLSIPECIFTRCNIHVENWIENISERMTQQKCFSNLNKESKLVTHSSVML